MKAYIRSWPLSVIIQSDRFMLPVWNFSFPRYVSFFPHVLEKDCQERIEKVLEIAKEICDRFINDGRTNATEEEVQKAFNRTYNLS